MARLLGVDIPNRKKIAYSLRYIYGIGPTRANKILEATQIDPDRRTQDLNEQELSQLSNYIIENKIVVEGDLRRMITNNLKRLQKYKKLPWSEASKRTSCPRPAYHHQREDSARVVVKL